jgi:hypothetical protein
MATRKKTPTPKKQATSVAPEIARPKVSAVKVSAPKKGVSPARAAMTALLVSNPNISVEELSAKLASSGHALSASTVRTMHYHAIMTVRALAEAGLLNVPSSSSE